MSTKAKHFVVSFGTTLMAMLLLFIWLYPGASKLGEWFAISAVLAILHHMFLYTGFILLLVRLLKLINNEQFIYVFGCSVNIVVGLIGVFLYWQSPSQLILVNACLYNLLVGIILFFDVILFK